MDSDCPKCGWNLPQPTLADAVIGYRECSNCETREAVPEKEKLEAVWDVEQRLHVIESNLFPLGK